MFWGFVIFFLNHILTKSLLINNFFHFLNSVDLNELLLTVLAIHLILSFLFKYTCCLLVFTNKFISDGFFFKIPNLVFSLRWYFSTQEKWSPCTAEVPCIRVVPQGWTKARNISGIIFISSTISQKGFILLDVYKHLI